MKRFLLTTGLVLLVFASFAQPADTWSVKFSDAILNRYKPTINAMTSKGWEYSNSIVLHGMEKIYRQLPDSAKYLNYIKAFVDANINSSGNITAFGGWGNTLDQVHPGILCLFLYEITGQAKYKTAATNIRNNILTGTTFNKTPDGGFWHKQTFQYNNVMMLDGIYMAAPFLAKYGVLFNDDSAVNTATRQTLLIASHTYDPSLHLAKHAWHYDKTKTWADPVSGASHEVWSRGMGWYMMAIVDILSYLPLTHKDHNSMRELLDSLCIGIKKTQDAASGLWYQVMDKAGSAGNYTESSGSGMFIYALKKAVDSGWIDTSYRSVANKGWQGLQTKIGTYTDGFASINDFAPAMGVQDNYNGYVSFPYTAVDCPTPAPAVQHPHGYCGLLMAASVMEFPLNSQSSFTFTGNGDWDIPANWLNNTLPPAILPNGSNIIIDPATGGTCILNIEQHIASGATLTVMTGADFIIQGNLVIQ